MPFHNPYHFVPVEPGARPDDLSCEDFRDELTGHVTHDRFVSQTSGAEPLPVYSGRIVCRLLAVDPIVIGSEQDHPKGKIGHVDPFEIDGRPAIPASSLRGLISSVAEAASNSALRVLDNKPFSYRMPMEEGLPAIGMLVRDEQDPPRLRLRPLTLPHLRWNGAAAELDPLYLPMFQALSPRLWNNPHPYLLKVFIDGYEPAGGGRIQRVAGSFLDIQKPISYSADHRQGMASTPPIFWYMQLNGRSRMAGNRLVGIDHRIKNGRLVGQYAHDPTAVGPLSSSEYEALTPTPPNYVRGILRVLGIDHRETEIPTGHDKKGNVVGKKHEIFIPYPEGAEQWNSFEIPDEVLRSFHDLADERTDSMRRKDIHDDALLPFALNGARRNDDASLHGKYLRLREGDIVFFRPDGRDPLTVGELAISSIWRRGADYCHDYFAAIADNPDSSNLDLLPFHPDRTVVTIAEQVFGFVENRSADDPRPEQQALALAGRIRFSSARLTTNSPTPYYEPYPNASHPQGYTPLKILSTPKTPCPSMYFAPRDGDTGYIPKVGLNPMDHRPLGRKMYLHRSRRSREAQEQPWVTSNAMTNQDQKNEVRPIRAGSSFLFHIDFSNLSRRELALLCYAISPSDAFHHKIGMGKPLGLGSVKISPVGIFFIDRRKRYESDELTAPRYHGTWKGDQTELQYLNPSAGYIHEFNAIRPTAKLDPGYPSFDGLRDEFRQCGALADTVGSALEAIGSLEVNHEVDYPRRQNQQPEDLLYRWFVENDRRDRDEEDRQSLRPIVGGTLPTLEPN